MKDWTDSDAWYFAHLLSKVGRPKLGGEGRTGDSGGPDEGLHPETPGLFTSPPDQLTPAFVFTDSYGNIIVEAQGRGSKHGWCAQIPKRADTVAFRKGNP